MNRVWIIILCLFASLSLAVHAGVGHRDGYKQSKAIVIGIGDYSRWNELPGVSSDVAAVSEALDTAGFDVTVLRNPNKETFLSSLTDIAPTATYAERNRLLIYFAGHGWSEPKTNEGYLIMPDAPLPYEQDELFTEHAVSMQELNQVLGEYQHAHHVLVALDSCFSGSIFDSMGKRSPSLSADVRDNFKRKSQLIIASGTAEQEVPDESLFRQYFISAMFGAADFTQDGVVSGTELALFIRSKVSGTSGGGQTPQFINTRPTALGEEQQSELPGEFVFFSGLESINQITGDDASPQLSSRGLSTSDCGIECPEMTVITAGELPIEDPEVAGRNLVLSQKLAISTFEVQLKEWDACFRDGWCSKWISRLPEHSDRHPVHGVAYADIKEFLQWLRMKTSDNSYRLPTHQEWLYAAHAGAVTNYPWGSELISGMAACEGCNTSGESRLQPVGRYAANNYGLYDVLGNVWEWVARCEDNEKRCGLAGASWATDAESTSLHSFGFYPADQSMPNFGFRVVRDIN